MWHILQDVKYRDHLADEIGQGDMLRVCVAHMGEKRNACEILV